MKKKFLSLMMAAAVVATTSVSAFAAVNTENVEVQANTAKQIEVPIQGDIAASDGTTVAGSITVTVPTSAAFKVDEHGDLTSGTMSIVNKGGATVSVIASKFVDANGVNGINLVKEERDLAEQDRSKVYLKLTGGDKEVVLTSEANDDNKPAGKMYDVTDTSEAIEEGDDFVIKDVIAGGTATLTLEGKGTAYKVDTNSKDAVNDSFRLVLKIKQKR